MVEKIKKFFNSAKAQILEAITCAADLASTVKDMMTRSRNNDDYWDH